MPITIQVTRGLLTPDGERTILRRVAHVLLDVHGLSNNSFMQHNVVGHLVISEPGGVFVGGQSASLAVIEIKVPSVTFRDRATQQRFIAAVTDIVDELAAGKHPRERTFVSVTYAVDGAWGIAGTAYSNDELGAAIAASR